MSFPVFTAEIATQLSPLFLFTVAGLVFLIFGAVTKKISVFQHALAFLFHAGGFVLIWYLWQQPSWPILGGMLIVDKFSLFFTGVFLICSLATMVISARYMERFGISRPEYLSMLFFAVAGMFVLVTSYNLISLFLGIELMSIPIYIMIGLRRRDFFANEAALKYFILGAFAIAFFLYGASLIYGLTETFNFKGILLAATEKELMKTPPFLLAMGLLLVGLIFKISAVPFHMWVPDVYQGAPSPVTGFMAAAVKAASFAAFLRLFYMAFMPVRPQWVAIITVLAVLTMTLGNIVALVQRNIKRMLAYSSIAHAGYILVGIAAISIDSTRAASSVMYYTLTYAFITLGTFALVCAVERRGVTRGLELDDYAGLGFRKPYLGFAMALFMFSLAGIPPTAGFFAKYYVFTAAISQGMVVLVIIAVLNSLLSLYYYLRVIVVMYMHKAEEDYPVYDDLGIKIVLFVAMVLVLWLGLGPSGVVPGIESVLEWTNESLTRLVTLK